MTQKDQRAHFRAFEGKQVRKQLAKVNEDDDSLMKQKLTLTKRERLVLEGMMLTPVLVTLTVLYTTHSFLLTLIGFHIALVAYPIYFTKVKNVNINWISLLKQDLQKFSRKLKHDMYLAAVPTFMLVVGYIGFRNVCPDFAYHNIRIPSIHDTLIAVLLAIEFIIINPIVEEVFWRFFCDLFIGQGKTILQKIDVAFHFALYHWFVIYFMFQDIYLTTGGAITLFVVGYTLTLIKQRYGLITTMIIHVGIDLAAGFVVWDLQSRFLPFY